MSMGRVSLQGRRRVQSCGGRTLERRQPYIICRHTVIEMSLLRREGRTDTNTFAVPKGGKHTSLTIKTRAITLRVSI